MTTPSGPNGSKRQTHLHQQCLPTRATSSDLVLETVLEMVLKMWMQTQRKNPLMATLSPMWRRFWKLMRLWLQTWKWALFFDFLVFCFFFVFSTFSQSILWMIFVTVLVFVALLCKLLKRCSPPPPSHAVPSYVICMCVCKQICFTCVYMYVCVHECVRLSTAMKCQRPEAKNSTRRPRRKSGWWVWAKLKNRNSTCTRNAYEEMSRC